MIPTTPSGTRTCRSSRPLGSVEPRTTSPTGSGRAAGTSAAMLDRLTLTNERVTAMADGLREVAALPDPVGEVVRGSTLPNGLELRQVRVPLGVVGIIYEARPNVTVDAAGLCVKSGNAVLLRGSGSAASSNQALVDILADAGTAAGLPAAVPASARMSTRAWLELAAEPDPRSSTAFPLFTHRPAASTVTLGRAS